MERLLLCKSIASVDCDGEEGVTAKHKVEVFLGVKEGNGRSRNFISWVLNYVMNEFLDIVHK